MLKYLIRILFVVDTIQLIDIFDDQGDFRRLSS